MGLTIGTQLGSHEITAFLGKGGMGEVYRARDLKLKREVAIKILPDEFARDPDRVARFQREAEVLASLNHPNIAAIYDLQEARDTRFLVLEMVDGETLAERMQRGPIPVEEALTIGSRVAEALEAAHERGVVHRDLKPANVKITSDGNVKVLDFGLAKAMDREQTSPALSNSPTLMSAASNAGIILGTAAYMSPEQAKGREVDKRTDIFAFGALLYEMLTGRPAFDGDDVAEILARVIEREPDWGKLPSKTPPRIHEILRRCLEKDPKKRRRDAGDVRIDIEQSLTEPATALSSSAAARSPRLARVVAVGAVLVTAALATVLWLHVRETPFEQPPLHLSVSLPGNTEPLFFAVSPDGRSLVWGPYQGGLGIRSFDSGEIRFLTGTPYARTPFWSPDSHTIAFFTDGKLKTVSASGGPPVTLCENTGNGSGGSWNRAGTIVFATDAGRLDRVSAAGGQCTELDKPEPGVGRRIPVFLPDGDHFLYMLQTTDEARQGVYVASLGDPNGRRLLADPSSAMFVPNAPGSNAGRLLFVREQTLMAQVFDAASLQLSGDPAAVAGQVSFTATRGQIAATADANGALMYLINSRPDRHIVWYDRSGTDLGRAAATAQANGVSLSPDGKRIAFVRSDSLGSSSLWLQDLERNQETSLTRPLLSPNGGFAWSPDGQRIAFSANGAGVGPAMYVKNLNGGKEETLLQGKNPQFPSDWSRDDRWLVYTENNPKTGADIWLLPDPSKPSADRKPFKLLGESFNESEGQISPDGKWLAYSSDESGRYEVYLRPFNGTSPASDRKWQLSTSAAKQSGIEPRWRADGKELFYMEADPGTRKVMLMSVPMVAAPNPAGTPRLLFEFQSTYTVPRQNAFLYSPAADGQRFLINVFAAEDQPSLELILNWGKTVGNR